MPTWVVWVLGALNVIQFIQYLVDRTKRSNIVAAQNSLEALRAMCTEAINTGEVINSPSAKQFVRQIAYMALSIENTLAAVLPKPKKI